MKRIFVSLIITLGVIFCSRAQNTITHTVQRGETIESIAQKYGVTVEEINKINSNNLFFVGKVLSIPQKKSSTPTTSNELVVPQSETLELKPSSFNRNEMNYPNVKQYKFFVDLFGGYINYAWDDGSPEPGLGFGVDFGLQYQYKKSHVESPKGLLGELSIGYSYRGSGAYPIHYIGTRLLPLSYRTPISSNMSFIIKIGAYSLFPLSKLETSHGKEFDCNIDFGLSAGLGVEIKRFGLIATYEHGFSKVCDHSTVDLYNRGGFIVLSYKF